ncbi:MAG: 50S ribosomal protein L21, partial [Bacteroidota bacterium]
LSNENGDVVIFDQVHLVDDNVTVSLVKPTLTGESLSATVFNRQKGDKVIVFRKKRRKGFKVKNGHRQCFTKIEITGISSK